MLTVLELEQFDEKIKNLSGGQKKRAALCKSIAAETGYFDSG